MTMTVAQAEAEMRRKKEREKEKAKEREVLRDHFAGLAMQGYIAFMGCEAEATGAMGGQNSKVLARNAYAFADAMLKEREKGDD